MTSLIPISTALPFFISIRNEAGLHVAAEALQSRGRQDAFRSAADTHDDVDTGAFDTGIDSRRDVAVGNELDTGTGAAALVDEVFVARPVENDDSRVIDASF